ncbi:hypothetical protein L218DRAFT_961331 [Marasmius fiardii PR-910]|nr:hypothetical protein L218DRAFT_961331 [Marasmius fiardii PR-910]
MIDDRSGIRSTKNNLINPNLYGTPKHVELLLTTNSYPSDGLTNLEELDSNAVYSRTAETTSTVLLPFVFSTGPTNCVGKNSAMMEMSLRMVLSVLVKGSGMAWVGNKTKF